MLAVGPPAACQNRPDSTAASCGRIRVFSPSSPYILGGATILAVVCLEHDQWIYDRLYSWRQAHAVLRKTSPIVTEIGNGATALVLLGGIGAYGYFADDHRASRLGEIGLESFALSGAVTQGIKLLAGRERPSASTRPGGFWNGPFSVFRRKNGFASFDAFPSGHTTTAFSMATVFADTFDETPWVPYVSYGLAGVVGVTRVMEQTHWASDVIVGAVIGTYCTKFVEYLNSPSSSLTVLPRYDDSGCGILLSVRL